MYPFCLGIVGMVYVVAYIDFSLFNPLIENHWIWRCCQVFRVSSKVYMLSTCLSSYTLGEMVSDKEFCPSFLISWNFAKLLGILVGCPVLFECCYYSFFLAVSILWSTVVDLVLFVYPLFLALNVWFMWLVGTLIH